MEDTNNKHLFNTAQKARFSCGLYSIK